MIFYCTEMKNRFFYVNVQNLTWNRTSSCWETDFRWLDRFGCYSNMFVGYVLYSSVDMATHSTQSMISDKVINSCHSSGSSIHNSTEDEVFNHVILNHL